MLVFVAVFSVLQPNKSKGKLAAVGILKKF